MVNLGEEGVANVNGCQCRAIRADLLWLSIKRTGWLALEHRRLRRHGKRKQSASACGATTRGYRRFEADGSVSSPLRSETRDASRMNSARRLQPAMPDRHSRCLPVNWARRGSAGANERTIAGSLAARTAVVRSLSPPGGGLMAGALRLFLPGAERIESAVPAISWRVATITKESSFAAQQLAERIGRVATAGKGRDSPHPPRVAGRQLDEARGCAS